MFEETNQTEFENLFEEAEVETETTAETPAEESAEASAETQPEAPPAMHKVKYLGKEMEMTVDQLIATAQKGMDYDRIRQERDALKNAPELRFLDQLARENNMSRAQLVEYLQKQRQTYAVQENIQQGMPEEAAKRMAELQRKELEWNAREEAEQKARAEQQKYVDFVKEYPEVRDFPPEVRAAIENGDSPLSAYRAWENKQLRAKIAAFEQADRNAKKAVGPIQGDAPPEDGDDFLAGFAAAFK